MSDYYKYEFVSPEPLFAQVKEEFRSYFDAGMVDDLMFPKWTEDVLKSFRKSALKIQESILFIDDYKATLPPDFKGVREAWICGDVDLGTWQHPNSCYYKVTTKLSDTADPCDHCDPCTPRTQYEAFFKTNEVSSIQISVSHLLKPGTINAIKNCGTNCPNLGSTSMDVFDIHGNKFVTNFVSGTVYLKYYSEEYDEQGYQKVPDNIFIQRAITAYLKWQVILQLWNQVTDETYNQIERKVQYYSSLYYDALVIADVETKKQTLSEKRKSIIRTNRSLNRFKIR